MKRKMIFALAFLLLAGVAFSQTYMVQVKPAGGKLWGYANQKGEVVIRPEFKKCFEFSSDGLAVVLDSEAKQYYFIDVKGKKLPTEITKFKLINLLGFNAKGFESGMAPVSVGDMWGYLNTNGKLIIPTKYDNVTEFDGGFAAVKQGDSYFVVNTEGEETRVEGSGLLDINHFSEGLAPFRNADKKFGFIDTKGKVVIPANFESVGYFTNGMAWAKTDGKLLGYLDKSGAWVIKPQFDAGKNFDKESGLARVKSADSWAYVTKSGQLVYLKDTDLFEDFSGGLARGRKEKKFGFLNSKGEWAIAPQFDGARDFKNGYASVKEGELWGVIDKAGKWVIKPQFEDIKDMELVK
jgi:hypothetical protein